MVQWTRVVTENATGSAGPLSLWRVTGVDLNLHAAFTTRTGGVSRPPYETLNLGGSVGDDPESVRENRRRLLRSLPPGVPRSVQTVKQVHGTDVIRVDGPRGEQEPLDWWVGPPADAMMARRPAVHLAVFASDCLPVYVVDPVGGGGRA
ncbi:MAG: laccase domain-containing protein, partial [Bacillota bacterium]